MQRSGAGLEFLLSLGILRKDRMLRFALHLVILESRSTIQVVKLEEWLNDNLLYLGDPLSEFRTFDTNRKPIVKNSSQEVPMNQLKVKMKSKPWFQCWEHPKYNIKGIRFDLFN